MTYWKAWMACGLLMSLPAAAQADIFRWDNGQLIPGTQGITPGPGVNLSSPLGEWSSPQRNLRFADFSGGLDLTQANFSSSWLDNAQFYGANLTNANVSGAVVAGANFDRRTYIIDVQPGSGITLPQLYSTASYQQRNLRGIGLNFNDLTGGDFSGQDLTGACFLGSTLTNADFGGAIVTGANYFGGITSQQLYSTASYQQKNLLGIGLGYSNLSGWDFSGQDLTDADLFGSPLTNANLAGAVVAGANFGFSAFGGGGITLPQLYSTASYQQRNLRGSGLFGNNLTGGDFSGQDLTGADFAYSTLTNADLSGAVIAGAGFSYTTLGGDFTKEQLYSTASYQQRELKGINLSENDLTGWDFSGQHLAGADFIGSPLMNANFSFADLRGARMDSAGPFQTRNTIREFGAINGLDLEAGETLVVRDSTIGITVNDSMNAASGGTLELVLGDAAWDSTMSVEAGITPDLGGTLRVRFGDQANLASMLGTTFDFFNWPGLLESNNRFDAIELPPGTQWDFSQLYVSGTAKLTAIPEPSGDYNRDGTVDAADYVVWRKGLGTTYTQAEYDVWRANFRQTIGSGAAGNPLRASAESLSSSVPEPATSLLCLLPILVTLIPRRVAV